MKNFKYSNSPITSYSAQIKAIEDRDKALDKEIKENIKEIRRLNILGWCRKPTENKVK